MSKYAAYSLLLAVNLPGLSVAEPVALRCVYTQVTFNAVYMDQAEHRACPQDRCFYDLRFDSNGSQAAVNGSMDYRLKVEDSQYLLAREVMNPVVKGVDRARFAINREDLSYRSLKSTPPGVTLETAGQCQLID